MVIRLNVLALLLLASTPSFADTLSRPVVIAGADFDGDGVGDLAQGFPEASDGQGRVDIFWGRANFRAAWPTVLSAVKNPATELRSGRLGEALASGDFDDDGCADLAIGVPNEGYSGFVYAGSVVVIYGCRVTSVATTANGAGKAAVGSPLDPSAAAGTIRIQPTTPVDYGLFGYSLAAGDFDGDGYVDLAIGSPYDWVGGDAQAGSVTLIDGGPGGLDLSSQRTINQDQLPPGNSPANPVDHFGWAVSAAKLDADDYADLVVGVPDEDYGTFTNVGEIDVFWGGAGGISASNTARFRHSSAMTGGGKDNDRLGSSLVTVNRLATQWGSINIGLSEATTCNGRGGHLLLSASMLGAANPTATLGCDPNLCVGSTIGDGALPAIPVNFIVLANAVTAGASPTPTATSNWTDPITGEALAGDDYFYSMIDLLNQQVRADDGDAVCQGNDCVRFVHRSHTYYSTTMFDVAGFHLCPLLDLLAQPNILATENCDSAGICPFDSNGIPYTSYSNFLQAAVEQCILLDKDALNIFIYDNCSRAAGADNVLYTGDDTVACSGSGKVSGHGRDPAPGFGYAFVDYARALLPRAPSGPGNPVAAEEHEVGHALGLDHACDTNVNFNHIMQGAECPAVQVRNLGFATASRTDVDGDFINEITTLVQTSRDHSEVWQCP